MGVFSLTRLGYSMLLTFVNVIYYHMSSLFSADLFQICNVNGDEILKKYGKLT